MDDDTMQRQLDFLLIALEELESGNEETGKEFVEDVAAELEERLDEPRQ